MVTVPCIDSAENKCRHESCLYYCNHIQIIYANTQFCTERKTDRQDGSRDEETDNNWCDRQFFQNQNSNVQLVQCTDQMKIKCPLHIMYFTFVNPHNASCIVPLQYSLHRFSHCQTERPKGYEEFLHTRSCVSTTVFFYCLTLSHFTIFFFNNLH